MKNALLPALLASATLGMHGLGAAPARTRTFSKTGKGQQARKADKARRRAVKQARRIQRSTNR